MHLNGKVIRNVKDGRAAEPRKEQICNSSHPDGERAEKLKVRVVFKTVLSKMNKAVADGRTDTRQPESHLCLAGLICLPSF